jgi:DNA mismatch repair protein MutL
MDRQSSLGLNYALNGRAPDFVPFDKAPGQSGSDLQSVGPGHHSGRVEAGSDDSATSADDRQQNATHQLDRQIQAETGASPIGLQLHQRYLVTENEEGMVVVDQHALHERILYEQIRNKVLSGKMETQRLLVPEPVSLTAAEAAAALEARETLAKMGIEIEAFGGDTVLVSAYPAMLANMSPNDILRQVVDLLLEEGKTPERRDILDELLHMISCKAAIKAGDRLSSGEVTALLEQRHHFQDSHHCPHGRPTALVFTREELDKRFRRT